MPDAFKNEAHASGIRAAIRTLFRRRLSSLVPPNLTGDDLLALFAPKSDRLILKVGRLVADINEGVCADIHFRWPVPGYELGIAVVFDCVSSPTIPLRPKKQVLQEDAPSYLVDQITTYVTNCLDAGRDFGRCIALFDWLNVALSSPAQIAYVWPSIHVLMALGTGFTAPMGKAPTKGLSVPLPIREHCRLTSATIALANMLPEDINQPRPDVLLKVHPGSIVAFEEPLEFNYLTG